LFLKRAWPVAPYPFEAQNTTRFDAFRLTNNLLYGSSRLLRSADLSPFVLNESIYLS